MRLHAAEVRSEERLLLESGCRDTQELSEQHLAPDPLVLGLEIRPLIREERVKSWPRLELIIRKDHDMAPERYSLPVGG